MVGCGQGEISSIGVDLSFSHYPLTLTSLFQYAPNDALRRVKSQTPPEGGQLFSRNVLLEQLGGEGD